MAVKGEEATLVFSMVSHGSNSYNYRPNVVTCAGYQQEKKVQRKNQSNNDETRKVPRSAKQKKNTNYCLIKHIGF